MSVFLSKKFSHLDPYVPGEQPNNLNEFVKLNTNESPYSITTLMGHEAFETVRDLRLYPDPSYVRLRETVAKVRDVGPNNVVPTNGSDEALSFAFNAFCDDDIIAVFPDICYGLYKIFCNYFSVDFKIIPLLEDFTIDVDAFCEVGKSGKRATIFLTNPNAPTGIALPLSEIERIVQANPQNVVVIDEAYIGFGAESAIPLTKKYSNLLIVQTTSKSRSLAGARLGYAIGNEELIADLNLLRNSTNPYNVNSMTTSLAISVLEHEEDMRMFTDGVVRTREIAVKEFKSRRFEVLDSKTNFLFVRHPAITGEELYSKLKEHKILVRHFKGERINNYNRVSIGTIDDMGTLFAAIDDILGSKK